MPLFGRPSEEDDQRAAAYAAWLQQRNPYAMASLILGIFSLIEMGVLIIFGVGGIACGVIALKQLRRAGVVAQDESALDRAAGAAPMVGHRMAWLGIALSVASLIIAAVLYDQSWN